MRGSKKRCRLALLLLASLMLNSGCGPAAPETALLPVPLPTLEGLADAAQQQLRLQHARIRGASQSIRSEALGLEYGKLGQLLFTYDFLDAAEPAFRNARSLRPEDEQWSYYLGMLYRQKGDFEAAAAQFERVLERQPDDVFARLRLAEIYLELGRAEGSKTLLEAVIAEEPRNAFAYYLLGQIAYEAEAFAAAVSHYERVLKLQPTATQVHAPLGLAFRNLGDQQQSQYHLARRGRTLVQLNDPRVVDLEAFKQSSGATALTQGQQLVEAGHYLEAITVLERAVEQDPTNPSAFLSLGVALAYTGDQAEAVEAFRQAISLDSTQSKAYYNLGAISVANGQQALAEEQFRAALANDPRHRNAHLELAQLLRRTGRCREALEHFQRTLEITPGDIAARQHQALCHLYLGQYAAARTLLEDGLAANPDHLGFVDALARVLASSSEADVRDGARALRLAEQALSLQRRTETLETLAMAHAELGQYQEAVAWQNEAIRTAEQRGHIAYLAHLKTNLHRYQFGTPCRTPWPPFMYEQ